MVNISNHERVVRVFGGVALSSIFIYMNSVWAVVGLIPFVTGIIGNCPLYSLLGINRANHV
jgi:hypothetical protein